MKSFPFDSEVIYDAEGNPEYDRGADSTILSDFIHLMFTDGVFPNPSTGLQVTASSEEMSVVVKPGNCMIQGRMGIEETDRTLVFNAAGSSYDRIDSVVARLNTNHDYRDIDLYVVKGTEASTPTAPELTRTGGIYELRLANVFIAKNTTLISAERITDTRLSDECGIVTSNPNPVDTATIFNQYQAALDKYLQYVQECIDGTTAGNLQTQIDRINSNLNVISEEIQTLKSDDWKYLGSHTIGASASFTLPSDWKEVAITLKPNDIVGGVALYTHLKSAIINSAITQARFGTYNYGIVYNISNDGNTFTYANYFSASMASTKIDVYYK